VIMQGKLRVHFDGLTDLAQQLESAADELERHLSDMDGVVKQIAESWKGEAHGSFAGCYQQWRSASGGLHATLRRLHKVVHTAHGNYSAAKAANLRMWKGR
jgi:WXG100 family type VII secretion target